MLGIQLSTNVLWAKCGKLGSEAHLWHRGSVSGEFCWCRSNGARALLCTNTWCAVAPPWGQVEHFEVVFLPWPSRNVRAKLQGNSTVCAWVQAFWWKRRTLQTLGGNRRQSGRSMRNLKDPLHLLAVEMVCSKERDFWSKNGWLVTRNVFWTFAPAGGAIRGECHNCAAEAHLWHPGIVCGECRCCRGEGS